MNKRLLALAIVVIMVVTSFVTLQPTRAADPVVIRWRTRVDNDAEQKVYQAISDEVSKELEAKGIVLKYEPQPVAGYFENLQTQVASGTAPDVFWIVWANTADFANKGAILDLKSIADADKDFDMTAFYAPPFSELTHVAHCGVCPATYRLS
jgi:ABC-type glycerol-3-phosphate transport system substrate-binding protein